MKTTEKFLQFNGKNIYFLAADGEWFIAIKPICEALGLEYTRQFKNLKDDKILSQLLAEQPMVGNDNRKRNMLCLPEKFIYGWIFSIHSEAPGLVQYKLECYTILFNHFHGTITGRKELFSKQAQTEIEIEQIKTELFNNPSGIRLSELEEQKKRIKKQLNQMDNEMLSEQFTLWKNSESLKPINKSTEA